MHVDYSVHALPAILLKSEPTFSASAIINGQPTQTAARRELEGISRDIYNYIYHGNHGDALYLYLSVKRVPRNKPCKDLRVHTQCQKAPGLYQTKGVAAPSKGPRSTTSPCRNKT